MEKKELKILSGSESYGQNHNCHTQVVLNSNLYDELSEEAQHDLSWKAQEFIEQLRYKIELKWAEENLQDKRQENIDKMLDLFKQAGFDAIHSKIIPNEYSDHPVYYTTPWLQVTTAKGPIKIGWRKRVINIDWSESDINIKSEELFPNENVTKYDNLIHAWGYEKAVEYLTILANI